MITKIQEEIKQHGVARLECWFLSITDSYKNLCGKEIFLQNHLNQYGVLLVSYILGEFYKYKYLLDP